jgi:hypothetical protein
MGAMGLGWIVKSHLPNGSWLQMIQAVVDGTYLREALAKILKLRIETG